MNALQRRLAVVTDARATLIAQLSELNELRDRFREAHLAESNIVKKTALMPVMDMLQEWPR
jgi:hypothetical protein